MKRIFLVGYMGAGKTTIGKELSGQMHLSFIDLDYFIEGRYHKTVSQLFAERSEEGFRKIEQNTLHEVAGFEDIIISTGGGAPCFYDNMSFMNLTGTTVYLRVSAQELANRIEPCKYTRPVLSHLSGEELTRFVAASLAERSPYYEQAHITFDAETINSTTDRTNIGLKLKEKILFLNEEC
ncbi:MAG: shikimate kinase [Tannerella sp.]|jgi:shikimate kinase|nr:shikimate kinase [Tannerella sp.]